MGKGEGESAGRAGDAAGFPLADAAGVLAAAGLLAGVRVWAAGHWRPGSVAGGGGAEAGAAGSAGGAALRGAFAGAVVDSRLVRGGELFVALPGERTDGRSFVGAALAAGAAAALAGAWRGPGPDPLAAVRGEREGAVLLLAEDPRAALARLAAAWRARLPARVIAVTGTNGKTTTKDLLAGMLSAAGPAHATAGNFNNELGLPLTLLGLRPEHRFAVLELGASAVGHIARLAPLAAPHVGIITNASPAHLAEFGSLDGIIAGKGELLDALPADGAAVLNADSPGFAAWTARARCRVVSHGEAGGEHRWRWSPAADPGRGLLELDGAAFEVPLPGRHNGANLAAALLAARLCGLDDAAIRAGLAAFAPSPHRGALLEIAGVRFLDDCYNANPVSMAAAAAALLALPGGGRALAVLGRMAELGPQSEALHVETGARLAVLGLDLVVAVGEGSAPLAAGCRAAGGAALHLATHAEAARWLAAHAAPGDRVLLKGSRSAGMEEVLACYRRLVAGGGGVGDGA